MTDPDKEAVERAYRAVSGYEDAVTGNADWNKRLRAILEAVWAGGQWGPVPESFRILALHSVDCDICCTKGTDNCDEHDRLCGLNAEAVSKSAP